MWELPQKLPEEGTYVNISQTGYSIQEKYKDKGLYDYTYGEAMIGFGRGDGMN